MLLTGSPPLQTALMGGHVDAVFSNSTMMVSSKEESKVIAIGSEKWMNQLGDIPTFKEFGMDFYPRIARGTMLPKAVPKDILKRKEV